MKLRRVRVKGSEKRMISVLRACKKAHTRDRGPETAGISWTAGTRVDRTAGPVENIYNIIYDTDTTKQARAMIGVPYGPENFLYMALIGG